MFPPARIFKCWSFIVRFRLFPSRHAFLIFHKVSYLTHSCDPNLGSVWKFHPTQDSSYTQNYFSVKFYAARDVAAEEVLTHSYMPETYSVRARQDFLKGHYYFTCDCDRCRKELFAEIYCYSTEESDEDEKWIMLEIFKIILFHLTIIAKASYSFGIKGLLWFLLNCLTD